MKKTWLLLGILLTFFMVIPSNSALFTPSYNLEGTLMTDTNAFFIGKTQITGSFTGYPVQRLINSSIVRDMGGFPLIGACSITDLDNVLIAENMDITSADSLTDLLTNYSSHTVLYSDVDIVTENGMFLLGIDQGNLNISTQLAYAITTFLPLEIIPDTTSRFLLLVSNDPLTMHCTGNYAVLTTLSESSTIHVKNRHGTTLWTGSSLDNYLIIENKQFTVVQQPPLSVLPLNTDASTVPFTLSITPADPKDIKAEQLIRDVSDAVENLGQATTAEFSENIDKFDDLIKTTSLVANGAMVFLRTNDTLTIDQSIQQLSSFDFIRYRTLDITNVGYSIGPTIQADCKLAFLGDHFYNPSAKQSTNGISFPYELLIIWILALCVFVYVRFFLRPPLDTWKDDRIRRYSLIIHIIFLITSVLLLDIEVNDLFGISGFTSLFTQGFSTMTGAFLLLELGIWTLGYFVLAIPIQLLAYSVLRYLGYGKRSKGIRKAIGDLSIWVFCGLYLLLFVNMILSLIHFNTLVPMR
jgi:hypothetical protein